MHPVFSRPEQLRRSTLAAPSRQGAAPLPPSEVALVTESNHRFWRALSVP